MNDLDRKIALRMISYGVYILTSKIGDQISAATVTWVSQASFEPPMLTVCIKKDSYLHGAVKRRGEFILHIMGEDQKELAANFFKFDGTENDLINGEKFELKNDLPVIIASPTYMQCKVLKILENGDHHLFLSEVKDVVVKKEVAPLELRKTGWYYGG